MGEISPKTEALLKSLFAKDAEGNMGIRVILVDDVDMTDGVKSQSSRSAETLFALSVHRDTNEKPAIRFVVLASELASIFAAEEVEEITGALTGTTDGAMEDVADITTALALDTSNTYTDAAVNAAVNAAVDGAVNPAIASINLQLKELQVKYNELLAAFKAANLMADAA